MSGADAFGRDAPDPSAGKSIRLPGSEAEAATDTDPRTKKGKGGGGVGCRKKGDAPEDKNLNFVAGAGGWSQIPPRGGFFQTIGLPRAT